jgi:hypothetical protein
MGNTNVSKEGIQFLVFTSPIGLHDYYFPIQQTFNMLLKKIKLLKDLRFMLQQINPCKLRIVKNEAYIIIFPSHRTWSRTPHI